jgi:hypothetical protein
VGRPGACAPRGRPRRSRTPLYPNLFLLADGRILHTGGSLGGGPRPQVVDLVAATLQALPGLRDPGLRGQCASVILPPAQDQEVMVISGGGGNPFAVTNAVDVIDMAAAGNSGGLHSPDAAAACIGASD